MAAPFLSRHAALVPEPRVAGSQGGLFTRTSGKLAFVWSPDAVNDAGGMRLRRFCRTTPPWPD